MKKVLFIFIGAALFLQTGYGQVFAQYVSESIPEKDRIQSIDVVELTKKVENAKKLIEEKGEEAFAEFRKEGEKWLGQAQAIFVIHAKEKDKNEGTFVLYPSPENVGKGALDMSKVNGKPFVRNAIKKKGEKPVWYGFIAGTPGQVPHASTIAVTPEGRPYVVAAGSQNLLQEQHFLIELVNAACDIVAMEGEKAFPVFLDKSSIFRFKDTYIFVFDKDHNLLFDPGRPEYAGKNLVDFPKYFPDYRYPIFGRSMNEVSQKAAAGLFPRSSQELTRSWNNILLKNGYAWSAYLFERPGKEKYIPKASYHKVVKGPKGKVYVVGCGVYLAE
jgi:hypothetical protein